MLLGNRLGFAKGTGQTVTGHNVHQETLLPASGVSKVITALTVLKLMEKGLVHPTSRVFGPGGVLENITPKKTGDKILDITVDDLLRHAGGWDAAISQMGDPIFNDFLVEGNRQILNISHELKLKSELTVTDIIEFMATKNLEFTPGTDSRVSNLGYMILGRVIEEVTGEPYEVIVKDHLMTDCGMWHTRLGPHVREGQTVFKGRTAREIKAELHEKHEVIGEYYAYVMPNMVDATLGWFTNVYDMMRLAQCIDGSAGFRFLNQTSLDYLIQHPRLSRQSSDNWYGAGFQVHRGGAIWVGDETHAPDVVFMHKNLNRHKDGDTYTGHENQPIAWTMLFEGKPKIDAPLKQMSRILVESVTDWPLTDAFTEDLSDTMLTFGTTTKLVKRKVEEHRANMYITALKRANFNIIWLNAYTYDDSTFIATIAEKDSKASRDCVALVGLEKSKLKKKKLELQDEGYNMTFFQNYMSWSHRDKYMFLAIFHKGAFKNESHILYGIQHFDRPYKTLLRLYEEQGYRPLVQSLEYKRDDALLSFILEADDEKQKDQVDLYASESNLTESSLKGKVRSYAREQKRLIYLDESNHRGRPKFSALFQKKNLAKWLLLIGKSYEDVLIDINDKQKAGYLPSIIVGYSTGNNNEVLKFVTYLEKVSKRKG